MRVPEEVFYSRLCARDTYLFFYLYSLRNRQGVVCITYEKLKKAGFQPSTLRASLSRLKERNLIAVKKQYFRYKDVLSHRNCYIINTLPPTDRNPDLPIRKILSLSLSPEEKGLLIFLFFLSNPEGDTFCTAKEILSYFSPKPNKALKSLLDKNYIEKTQFGIRIITDKVVGK